MEEIWNRMELERPPNATCCIESKKFDGTEFLLTLDKAIKDLTSQELFHKEAALLSRLIYRLKSKFRNDKGLKSMCKVNQALLKYLSLSLEKEYKILKDYVEIDGKYVTLPSKEMVEYVLIRIQGFAKLMLRVEEASKYSAHFLKCRINLGHAWSMAFIAYAVVSRIWILSRYLVTKSCTWYNELYQYLQLLESSGSSWLPANYELPSNLKTWLSVPWIDQFVPSVSPNYGLKNTMFKLITPHNYDSDEDLVNDVQDYSKIKSKNVKSYFERKNKVQCSLPVVESKEDVSEVDTGEFINRHAFNSEHNQNTPTSTKKFVKREGREDSSMNIEKNHPEFQSKKSAKDDRVNRKKNTAVKLKHLKEKQTSTKELLTFDDAKNKSDLLVLLNRESYPGLNKLQWNIIKKRSKKLLHGVETHSEDSKQSLTFKTARKHIKKWIT